MCLHAEVLDVLFLIIFHLFRFIRAHRCRRRIFVWKEVKKCQRHMMQGGKKQDIWCIDRKKLDVDEKTMEIWKAHTKVIWGDCIYIFIYIFNSINLHLWLVLFLYSILWYVPLCAFHRNTGFHLLSQALTINSYSIFLNHAFFSFPFSAFFPLSKSARWRRMQCDSQWVAPATSGTFTSGHGNSRCRLLRRSPGFWLWVDGGRLA